MEEIWKDIKDYEGLYQVSNFGEVKNLNTNRILKRSKHNHGHLVVQLYKNHVGSTKNIQYLVAQAFIPNPENKPNVNHIDEDKTNNNVNNIEWVIPAESNGHKKQRISIIATNLKTGESQEFNSTNECARQLGVNSTGINHALKGRRKQAGGYTFKFKEGYNERECN